MNDAEALERMEIDLDVATCGEILEAHGVPPTADLVTALWNWATDSIRSGEQ